MRQTSGTRKSHGERVVKGIRRATRKQYSAEERIRIVLGAEGEVSGIHLAQAILDRYAALETDEKRAFFMFLNDELELELFGLKAATKTCAETRDPADYRRLAAKAEPRRQELLHRLNQPTNATRRLVEMRKDLLADEREPRDALDRKVAMFYSITNCQTGMRGISFGNLLIEQVVDELSHELSGLETFVTLSPIPGLNNWLASRPHNTLVAAVLKCEASDEEVRRIAIESLLTAKGTDGAPQDSVARFHLGYGAQIHAVYPGGDTSETGLQFSSGVDANYCYDPKLIEQNLERFLQDGLIATAPGFRSPSKARAQRTRA